jgi:hypothetical protein
MIHKSKRNKRFLKKKSITKKRRLSRKYYKKGG